MTIQKGSRQAVGPKAQRIYNTKHTKNTKPYFQQSNFLKKTSFSKTRHSFKLTFLPFLWSRWKLFVKLLPLLLFFLKLFQTLLAQALHSLSHCFHTSVLYAWLVSEDVDVDTCPKTCLTQITVACVAILRND